MSVQAQNEVNNLILRFGINTVATALAASELASPIGALGGAIVGAVWSVTSHCIGLRILNSDLLSGDPTDRVLAAVLVIFGSYAAVWSALAVAGISITVMHMLSLAITSVCTQFFIEKFLTYLTRHPVFAHQPRELV